MHQYVLVEETLKAEFAILPESPCKLAGWMVSRKGNLCKKWIFSASRENPRLGCKIQIGIWRKLKTTAGHIWHQSG